MKTDYDSLKNMTAKQKEKFDEMYTIVNQAIFMFLRPEQKLQQIAAAAAIFAIKLAKDYDLDARDCADYVPTWIHRIIENPEQFGEIKSNLHVDIENKNPEPKEPEQPKLLFE